MTGLDSHESWDLYRRLASKDKAAQRAQHAQHATNFSTLKSTPSANATIFCAFLLSVPLIGLALRHFRSVAGGVSVSAAADRAMHGPFSTSTRRLFAHLGAS